MFKIGFGEICIVILVAFFFSPRDLPKVMRKIGILLGTLERIRDEVFCLKKDIMELTDDVEKEKTTVTHDVVEPLKESVSVIEEMKGILSDPSTEKMRKNGKGKSKNV